MKKITMKNKLLILLSFVFIFISSFAISTFAYHVDSNGNLVSDNILKINDTSYTSYGVNFVCSNNKITLNGTAETTGPVWFTINIPSGTYTIQDFNNFIYNDGFRITLRQGYSNDKVSLYYTSTDTYATFTSDVTMDILSITIVNGVTYNNVTLTPTLVTGNIPLKSYEPYGSIYFKDRVVSSLGLLNYTNIRYGYFDHTISYTDNTIYRTAFIYNGNYGSNYDPVSSFSWNDFILDSNNYIYDRIYSKYGSFFNTTWKPYDFINDFSFYSDNDNVPFTMNYELIAPISFTDVAFSFNAFELVYFYDSNGFLLKTITPNDNELLSLTDVSKIVCYNHINDIVGDSNYIITDLYAGSYDIGFSNGYNNALSYANPIIDEYKQAIDTYKDTIHILSERISSLENSNRNYTNLIWTIGATPWESFKHIWNVEFGGINIANIITGLVTALLVIYLIKKIWK